MEEYAKRNGQRPANKRKNPKWTVMVYLAGDNNLTSNCISVLQQLTSVKYSEDVCVLACFDSNTPWPKGSRYLAINCRRRNVDQRLGWEMHNALIKPRERGHNMLAPDFCSDGDSPKGRPMRRTEVAEGLRRFINWSMRTHPKSDHYMLVLYGHGPVVANQTFLARENPRSSLSLPDLPKILAEHFGPNRKLDILACQNCVMNGVETAYAVKDQVQYMIGSQGLVLTSGWPYEKIFGALVNNCDASAEVITKKVLKACARHLIDFTVMDRSSEQSVCDISKMREKQNVVVAIRKLGRELRKRLDFKKVAKDQKVLEYPVICDAIKLARLEAQSYWGEDFVDVYDFCERLLKKCNESIIVQNDVVSNIQAAGKLQRKLKDTELVRALKDIIQCCLAVMDRVEEMVPHSYYIGPELQYSHGLSIYFPWTMPSEPYYFRKRQEEHVLVSAFETYKNYDFVEKSEWAEFLRDFYRATLRKVRRAERKFSRRDHKEPLSLGVVREHIKSPRVVLTTENLRKTGSDGGIVDHDVWSYVKNYPRRNYVSPSDCPRTIDKAGRHRPGSRQYPNGNSPPISYLGWNICELVADVITKPAPTKVLISKRKIVPRQKTKPRRSPAAVSAIRTRA